MTDPLHPPIPPTSRRNMPIFTGDTHRTIAAGAFTSGGELYDDVRPGYPPEALELATGFRRVLDIGAGTGKLTRLLVSRGHTVMASDPSHDMLRVLRHVLPDIPCWQATAENSAVQSDSVDLVTCAQTWHWVDAKRASAEFDRIIVKDGAALLVWNNLDVSVSWVHRLSRIMHAGDVLKPGFRPTVGNPWHINREVRTCWNQELLPQQIIELAHTRSYWLRANDATRAKVDANLRWYLFEHLGFQADDTVELPYRCDAFLLRRQ